MQHLLSVLLPVLFFSLACIGAGSLVFRCVPARASEFHSTELTLFFLLGQGFFGSVLLIVAVAGVFTKAVLLILTVPCAAYAVVPLWRAAKVLPRGVANTCLAFYRAPLPWKLVALAAISLLLSWSAAISSAVEGDALAYYLALPKVVAASHRLVPLPAYESFTNIGMLAEMQLAALFLLGMPDASPRLFAWITLVAGVVVLMAIGRIAGLGRRAQVIILSMVVTSTAIAILMTGKTDFFAASYALAAILYALKSWDAVRRKSSLVLLGLFTGCALVAKLSYIVAFLPSVTILIFYKELQELGSCWRAPRQCILLLRTIFADGLIVVLTTSLAFIPQLIKNQILLGSLTGAHESFSFFSPETTHYIVLTYPFTLVFGSYWGQLGDLSPLLLAFFPILLLLPRAKNAGTQHVVALFIAGAAGLVAWVILFPSVPIPRYFIATLLIFTIPAAFAAERLSRRSWIASDMIAALMLVSFYFFYEHWSRVVFPVDIAYKYLFAEQTPEESGRTLSISEMLSRDGYEVLNKDAPQGARVFLASYYRFWLRPDLIQTTNNGYENFLMKWDPTDPDKIWCRLYEHGFQYIYMDSAQSLRDAIKSPPSWASAKQIFPVGKARNDTSHGSVYRLKFKADAPGPVVNTTQEVAPGAWNVLGGDGVSLAHHR